MKREWVLTQEAFDALLEWLDADDRERAGTTYETVRLRLIRIFACRGCGEAEDLADQTINRVAAKVKEIAPDYVGEKALYFYAVAQRVYLESLRIKRPDQESFASDARAGVDSSTTDEIEAEYECLERCMDQLSNEDHNLALGYYQGEKQEKIDQRKRLAADLGIALNALRIRAYRIRSKLQLCMQICLRDGPAH